MVAIAAQIDSGWLGFSMTFVATRAGAQLGTGVATVSSLPAGLVKATATIDMSSYGAGLVDLSLIQNTTNSLVWSDTFEIGASGDLVASDSSAIAAIQAIVDAILVDTDATIPATLSAVKAKTDLLYTTGSSVDAPVAPANNTICQIVIGDDYKEVNSRAFVFTVADPGNIASVSSAVCRFGAKLSTDPTKGFVVTGSVADLGGGQLSLTFELEDYDTASLHEGLYRWSAEVVDDSGNVITRVKSGANLTRLVAKQAS